MPHIQTHLVKFISLMLLLVLPSASNCMNVHNPTAEIPKFDARKAFELLQRQCDFGPRNPGSEGHRSCSAFLVKTLSAYADKVSTQSFSLVFGDPAQTVEATNIIAKFQPEKTRRILLCAHWDTRPWADMDPDPAHHNTPILGANDGASGVAVLLEIARHLKQKQTPLGVDIVFFDGEDAGSSGDMNSWAQGSAYYAQNLASSDRPVFGILIDMIGDADLAIFQEANSRAYARSVVDKVWAKAAELKLEAFKPQVGPSVMDDHIPLLQIGVPCIDLIDLDYPYWHTMADTPDNCSAASLEQVGTVLLHVIYTEK